MPRLTFAVLVATACLLSVSAETDTKFGLGDIGKVAEKAAGAAVDAIPGAEKAKCDFCQTVVGGLVEYYAASQDAAGLMGKVDALCGQLAEPLKGLCLKEVGAKADTIKEEIVTHKETDKMAICQRIALCPGQAPPRAAGGAAGGMVAAAGGAAAAGGMAAAGGAAAAGAEAWGMNCREVQVYPDCTCSDVSCNANPGRHGAFTLHCPGYCRDKADDQCAY